MAATYRIPHWLLSQLDEEQRKEAEEMLFEQNIGIGDVAKHFGVKHPNVGVLQGERVYWSDEQKIAYIKELAEKLGRTPYMTDIIELRAVGENIPSSGGFARTFGSWNLMLERAGLEPNVVPELVTVGKKIEKFGGVPSKQEIAEDAEKRWSEKNPEYSAERWQALKSDAEAYASELERKKRDYWKDPEAARQKTRDYRLTPEGELARRLYKEEYRKRPEVKIAEKLIARDKRAEEKEVKLMIAKKFGYDPKILEPGYATGAESRKQNAIVDLAYVALKGQMVEEEGKRRIEPKKIEIGQGMPMKISSKPIKIIVKHFESEPEPEQEPEPESYKYEDILKEEGIEKLNFLAKLRYGL